VKEREEAIKKRRSEREVDGSLFFGGRRKVYAEAIKKRRSEREVDGSLYFGGRREV
jgi:hypothetical protein